MVQFEWSTLLVTILAAILFFYGTLGLVSLSLNLMGRVYSRWAQPSTASRVEGNDQLAMAAPAEGCCHSVSH